MSDIKEDIKILEEIKDEYLKASEYSLGFPSDSREFKERAKAIENLIKAYQEDEKVIDKERNKSEIYEQQYNKLLKDFEAYKNDKDINYLDGIHHKKLVEKSIGQFIDKPEECWFDIFEVTILINDKAYAIKSDKDFISLKDISDIYANNCITVIAESPLSGAIYRYNNYGNKEWQLIGTMLGYA